MQGGHLLAQLKQKMANTESRNVLVYLASDLLAKGIPFLLIPFYTLYLSPAQFGNIAVFNVIVEILIIFVVMGGNTYFRVQYFKHDDHSSLLGSLIVNVLLAIPIAALLTFLAYYFDLNPAQHDGGWLALAVCIAISQSLILIALALFQCQGKAGYVGGLNLLSAAISGGVTLLLLTVGYSEESRYVAYGIASLVVLIFSILAFRKSQQYLPALSLKYVRDGLNFGFGVLPHALSWWARSGMDRIIITLYVSAHATGLYAVAAQLSLVIIVLSNAVNQAFTPKIMKMLAEQQLTKAFLLCFKITLGYLMICGVLASFSPLIFDWFIDAKFDEAQALLPMMCAVAFFQAVVTLCSNFLYFYKKVALLSAITFLTSLLHVAISFYVVEPFGVNGIIWSSIATYSLSSVVIIAICSVLIKRKQCTE